MSPQIELLGLKPGQSVYITPFTPMSEKLKRYLEQDSSINFLGFVDKSKQGQDIISPDDLAQKKFDKVLIISPNYGLEINKALKQIGLANSKRQLVIYNEGFRQISNFKLWWQKTKSNALPGIHLVLQRHFKKYMQRDNNVLFLGQGFIDLNIKQLYLYFENQQRINAVIATDNKNQIALLKPLGFKIIDINSWLFIFYSLRSKLMVLDHNPITQDLRYAINDAKTIQIWHGIPLKKIGHLANYKAVKYDLVISTSDFVTDYAFSEIFDYKRIINSGYPRNDVLFEQGDNKKSLALVDQDIYAWAKTSNNKLIVYTPTWRGDSFDNNPINLDKLNKFAKQHDLLIVLKMHPFIRPESFFDSMENDDYQFTPDYQHNIVFYPSTSDIYPLLAMSSLLITDYSSIYFDYLLLDKPIVFFIYDKMEYVKRHGDFMLDFEKSTPGLKPEDLPSLFASILSSLDKDDFESKRQELKEKLYETNNIGKSSAVIFDEALKLLAARC
ncbi:CDP-glycerol glycerophosphotransferase family protein [Aliiglaciecola sp. 2_MG-2023]|uniref:CDP-glycerol glycerophosphotransferase family protein n=1 Tax=unclassified Aliiglaciecola TaxID=2593648 RepID=UPI0026E3B1F3|nr:MULTISPECIES: CDP-glycerol glycerophosphotransferase family protein [unclassified Aliiglaciecola]MDO6709364.1 CDP-glycerol glycerophosphotransferase family protein [Aliiglaciecola sp. 2_MG-2023]MDO6750512.1 CDP-glycerol glycerophosphotransferase family protein [Aliiglaciecola sp. 1_MG-2023]